MLPVRQQYILIKRLWQVKQTVKEKLQVQRVKLLTRIRRHGVIFWWQFLLPWHKKWVLQTPKAEKGLLLLLLKSTVCPMPTGGWNKVKSKWHAARAIRCGGRGALKCKLSFNKRHDHFSGNFLCTPPRSGSQNQDSNPRVNHQGSTLKQRS